MSSRLRRTLTSSTSVSAWRSMQSVVKARGEVAAVPAYIDEAGARGFLRDLKPERDNDFGLMCAVVFDPGGHEKALQAFSPAFEAFRNAAPIGAKLHITEAFAPGNEAWRRVAEQVREEYLRLIQKIKPLIIYAARRVRLARASHERIKDLKARAKSGRRLPIKLVGENRPNDARIEDDLITSLVLRLDAFAEDVAAQLFGVKEVSLLFDETDMAERYETVIQRTREVSKSTTRVPGWDPGQNKPLEGKVVFQVDVPFRLDTKFIGEIQVVGKAHPLVLAADIVANHLAHHLGRLPASSPLHAPSSVEGWVLRDRVWGVMNDATEDQF
jgi:hypothetical protein